jgi:hypothetical protein
MAHQSKKSITKRLILPRVGLFFSLSEAQMIRIFSSKQAFELEGIIPEIAVIRSLQFQTNDYSPEEHGHIVVIQEGDNLSLVTEVSPDGLVLCDEDDYPTYEFIETFLENGRVIYEVVFQIDDSRTIAVIIPDEPWLDADLTF